MEFCLSRGGVNAAQFLVDPHEGLPHTARLRPALTLLERFPVITLIWICSPCPCSIFITLAGEGLQSLSPWLAGSPYPFRVGGSTWKAVGPLVCPRAGSSLSRRLGLAPSQGAVLPTSQARLSLADTPWRGSAGSDTQLCSRVGSQEHHLLAA